MLVILNGRRSLASVARCVVASSRWVAPLAMDRTDHRTRALRCLSRKKRGRRSPYRVSPDQRPGRTNKGGSSEGFNSVGGGNSVKLLICRSEYDLYLDPLDDNDGEILYTKALFDMKDIKQKVEEVFDSSKDLQFFDGATWKPLKDLGDLQKYMGGREPLKVRVPELYDDTKMENDDDDGNYNSRGPYGVTSFESTGFGRSDVKPLTLRSAEVPLPASMNDEETGQAQTEALRLDVRRDFAMFLEHSTIEEREEMQAMLHKANSVEYIAVNSENDVKLKMPSLMVDTKGMKLFYNGSVVQVVDAADEYKNELMEKVKEAQLIKEDGLMDENSLFKLVANATNNNCQKFRPKRAALSTNMAQESLRGASNCGEMFLQQVVYSPIAELFSCFDLSMYCADQHIAGAHAVNCVIKGSPGKEISDKYEWNQVRCNPDAAIKLTDQFYLIAMMEIKADSGINIRDDYRCKLMTCVSLLALKGFLSLPQNDKMPTWENLAIPFVLGSRDEAFLYVTRFENDGKDFKVVFNFLQYANFSCKQSLNENPSIDGEKVKFMSLLAILVTDIYTVVVKISNKMNMYLEKEDKDARRTYLPNAIGKTQSGSRSIIASSKKPRLHESTPGIDDPNARENAAENVASWNGQVQKLTYPFWRVRTYDLSEDEHDKWEAGMAFYQQKSPFYFRGYYGLLPVFCKVWREGDSRTSREDIVEEIAMNRLANVHGIPSPRVIDELTAVDVVSQGIISTGIIGRSTGCAYHVLVTEYYRNDNVAEEDALEFAILLVQAVLKLHKNGILHCDVKRSNILWNAELKMVRLVDFGLAQNEENARSYHATRIYEAPEIGENHPHSRMSDAFAVGKTMECVVGENIEAPVLKEVLNVAKLLQCPVISDRLSLEKAESMLMSLKESSLSATRSKRHFEDMQKEEIAG